MFSRGIFSVLLVAALVALAPARSFAEDGDDIELPPAKPMSAAEIEAWQKKFIEDGEKDDKERVENAKIEQDAKRKACMKASCDGQAALESPKTAPAACGAEDMKKYSDAFCDPGKKYPNLYKLQLLTKDAQPSACYYYLEALGNKRMDEAIARDKKLGASDGPFTTPKALWKAEKDCAPENTGGAYYGLKAIMIGPGAEQDGKKFCNAVQTPCMQVGGADVYVGNATRCQVGGAYVDQSCVAKGKLGQIAAALFSAKGQGAGCLNKDGVNPTYGKMLSAHLGGEPKTQICCGSGTDSCKTPVPGFALPKASSESEAYADANPPPNDKGTIRVTDAGLKLPQAALNATMFHEFLHRIGMCTHANHNIGSTLRAANGDGGCSNEATGFRNFEVGLCSCVNDTDPNGCGWTGTSNDISTWSKSGSDKPYKCLREVGKTYTLVVGPYSATSNPMPNLVFGKKICAAKNACDVNGGLASLNWGEDRISYDAVYGCEYYCYHQGQLTGKGLSNTKAACAFSGNGGLPIGTGSSTCSSAVGN